MESNPPIQTGKSQSDGRLFLKGLPEEPPNRHDTVVSLKLDGKPKAFDYAGISL